jgi:hydroxysqualene dehydroxylase
MILGNGRPDPVQKNRMHVLVIGAGWAGLAAAIEATRLGHQATVLEASRAIGGRARALNVTLPDGTPTTLDNGQHILIGAYSQTLQLMREVGVDTGGALLRMPLTLRYPDGSGLTLPDWSKPWFAGLDVAAGIFQAKGWSLGDKLSLLRAADAWRRSGFACPAHYSVAQLCGGISTRVMADMIDPLVVSALNTPTERASASVFLTVMRDALFAPSPAQGSVHVAGSNMLLPRTDLGALLPTAAVQWLEKNGTQVRLGQRVSDLPSLLNNELLPQYSKGLKANLPDKYDAVIIATPAWEAARLVRSLAPTGALAGADASKHISDPMNHPLNAQLATQATAWASCTEALQHEAITTVYAHSATARLPQAVMALRSGGSRSNSGTAPQPAQFVFDRGALSGQAGVLAFVVSASRGDATTLERQVIAQGRAQLGLPDLQAIKTIVEKRATFACTPGLARPATRIARGVLACGDYVDGPYPATLEGAVRSGLAAARALAQ